MNLRTNSQKGFTIVELLIVIVVIAILAAISIVAYTGIQNNARTSAAQSAASSVRDVAEAFNGVHGRYPATVGEFTSGLPATGATETAIAKLPGDINFTTAANVTAATDPKNVFVEKSPSGATAGNITGIRVTYRDYKSPASNQTITFGTATPSGTPTWGAF